MFQGSDLKQKRWTPEFTASDAAGGELGSPCSFGEKRSKKRQLAKIRNGDGPQSVAGME